MMYRVRFDLGDLPLVLQTVANQQALSRELLGVAEAARAKWTRLAQAGLSTTRQAYLLGLSQPFLEGPMQAVVELSGTLANMIERGADPFSLREGLLSKPEAKVAADGSRYRAVPMRMTAPGTVGRAGQPMDRVYEAPGPDSRSLRRGVRAGAALIGQEVYELAKKLRPGRGLPDLDLPRLKGEHTRDPFSGMVRGGRKGHRYYVAFRTVSDRFPSFEHPGFTARRFADAASEHARRVGEKALRRLAGDLQATPEPPVEV